MDKNIIHQLHADFERCARTDEARGVEYWFARDLQKLPNVISRPPVSCS